MIKRRFVTLRDINNEIIDSLEDGYYPPLLSSDPEKAALYVTVEDAIKAYEALTHIFSNPELKDYKILREAVNYNSANFLWFYTFYTAIKNEYETLVKTESARPVLPESRDKYEEIRTYLPFFILPYKDKYKIYAEQFVKENYMTYLKNKDGILEETKNTPSIERLNRVLYIKEDYEAEDFLKGYPYWYELPTKVFEQYNPKLNKRIRICYEHNEFRYFIAGASDNWEEIYEVPLEIDAVVHTLLFSY